MADKSMSPALGVSSPEPDPLTGANKSLKRKETSDNIQTVSKRAAKRKKKAVTAGPSVFDEIDGDLHVNPAIARMDGALLADHIARQTKRFEKDISVVELEDRRIPVTAIHDTSSWDGQRTLDHFRSFLEQSTGMSRKELSRAIDQKGSPHTIVVTSSGIRAADFARSVDANEPRWAIAAIDAVRSELRVFQTKESFVAKLFAKHIKLKDAIDMAKQTRMNIGVGTPQRLLDLLESDALSTNALSHIVIDASHVDAKKRGILDMRETLAPLIKLLTLPSLKKRYDKSAQHTPSIKLLFF